MIRPNREAIALLDRHDMFFRAITLAWGYRRDRPREIAAEHRALLKAFRTNDSAEAERLAREHIRHAMNDLLARRQAGKG
jgi:DNA-binding GntR family transcriptional regulator